MARVKIKSPNPKDRLRTNKLLEILSCNDVYVTRIIPINDGFIILTSSNNKLDKIFNNVTDKQLEENEFLPQIPPELSSNRSVLLFRVDNYIHENTEHDIKEEIQKKNEWVGKITRVYKFPKGNIIKITFDETQKAKKAQETGLKLFSMKIPKYDIKQDEHVGIMTCMKCYKMEDHSTAQCNQDGNFKVCSECSSSNHTWRECDAREKKCISCDGPHSTLAARCPRRKEIINKKRKDGKEKEAITYSETLKKHSTNQIQTAQPQMVASAGSGSANTTIYQAMLHSHFANVGKPGSYSNTFNNLMKAHNLPTLNIQEDPPSLQIIAKLSEIEGNRIVLDTQVQSKEMGAGVEETRQTQGDKEKKKQTEPQQKQQRTKHEQQKQPQKRVEKSGEKPDKEQQSVKPKHSEQGRKEEDSAKPKSKETEKSITRSIKVRTVTSKEIGLKVYTPKSRGWPKGTLTKGMILKGIEDGSYKWSYNHGELNEQEVMGKFIFNQIEMKECFHILEDSLFCAIESGNAYEEEEENTSPIQNQQAKRQRRLSS